MLAYFKRTKNYFERNFTEKYSDKDYEKRTRWTSIWVSTLVAFIESITASSLTPNVWPYMQQLDPSSTETYYGILRGVYSLGNVLAATITGYLSNRFNQTKTAMILAKSIVILSGVAFLLIEVITSIEMALFLVFQLLLGTSVGTATVYRTHIAMTSMEEDRSKAVGISQMANALGFVGGSIIQMIFAAIKYPGLKLLFGMHLNLYTAPMYFTILISIIGIILLVRILPAYSMTVFQWTSDQSVMYNSMAMGAVGVLYILWNVLYMFLDFGKRLSPRIAVITSLVIFFLFYFATFPWPFLITKNGVNETIGCKTTYEWCAHTPPINVVVYFLALVVSQGIALPLSMINMDILYSKILGPIKQGTLQGVFSAARELLAILGPLGFSQIYVLSGTIYIWIGMIVLTGVCLLLWVVFYRRMISYFERIELQRSHVHYVSSSF